MATHDTNILTVAQKLPYKLMIFTNTLSHAYIKDSPDSDLEEDLV